MEDKTVDLYSKYKVSIVEASAYMSLTPAVVRYRAKGLKRDTHGNVVITNRIIAKVSRPEVAQTFLSPVPEYLLAKLVQENRISPPDRKHNANPNPTERTFGPRILSLASTAPSTVKAQPLCLRC